MVYSDPRFEIILIHNVTAYYFNQCCILVKHNFFNLYYKNHNWLKEAENAKDNLYKCWIWRFYTHRGIE